MDRKILLKGKLYKSQFLVVMCMKTTCENSSNNFQGVVVKGTYKYNVGQFSKTWRIDAFEVYKDKLTI